MCSVVRSGQSPVHLIAVFFFTHLLHFMWFPPPLKLRPPQATDPDRNTCNQFRQLVSGPVLVLVLFLSVAGRLAEHSST